MKQLKKIELATCDVVEMNQQELRETEGGDWVDLAWKYWSWAWGGEPYSYIAVFAPGLAGGLRGLYGLCN